MQDVYKVILMGHHFTELVFTDAKRADEQYQIYSDHLAKRRGIEDVPGVELSDDFGMKITCSSALYPGVAIWPVEEMSQKVALSRAAHKEADDRYAPQGNLSDVSSTRSH